MSDRNPWPWIVTGLVLFWAALVGATILGVLR